MNEKPILFSTQLVPLDGKRVGIAFRAGGPHSSLHPDHWAPVARWKPGIHLRRVNARLFLHGISVRVERLHDISEDDARAEGADPASWLRAPFKAPFRTAFVLLWDSINGKRPGCSWTDNAWVWVVGWTRHEVRT